MRKWTWVCGDVIDQWIMNAGIEDEDSHYRRLEREGEANSAGN